MAINRKLNFLITILFTGIWLSVGSDPYDYLKIFETKNQFFLNNLNFKFIDIVNFCRAVSPLVILIICSIIIFKFNFFSKQKLFLYVLLTIQIIQILTTFLSQETIMSNYENTIDHIGRYHWLISSIATIMIFMIANRLNGFDMKSFFYISIFFLFLMVVWFTGKIFIDFYLLSNSKSMYHLSVYRDSAAFLGHDMPRITGLSRSIIIIYVILLFFNLKQKKIYNLAKYFLLLFLGTCVLLFQSKYSMVTFFLVNLIYFLSSSDKKATIKFLVVLLSFQFFTTFTIYQTRDAIKNIIEKNVPNLNTLNSKNTDKDEINDKSFFIRKFGDVNKEGYDYVKDALSSGRLELWKDAYVHIINRPLLGYGSMSDRAIINEIRLKNQVLVNPVSNAFLYSIISGGILCLILFIIFWLLLLRKLLKIFNLQQISNQYEKIGIIIIVLLGLRCLIENSMMLFGVDFLIILNSLYLKKAK